MARIAVEESIDYSQARILPGIEQSGHFVISLFVDLPSSSASIFGGWTELEVAYASWETTDTQTANVATRK